MSKESKAKKRAQKLAKANPPPQQPPQPKQQKASRPLFQSPVRRINRRFIITFAIWLIALIIALYFLTRH